MENAYRHLVRQGVISHEEEGFLYAVGTHLDSVRVPVNGDPSTERTVSEIPPSEIQRAITRIVAESYSISEDQLTERLADLFGWKRRGHTISEVLGRSVEQLVARGAILRSHGLITRPSEMIDGGDF